MKHTMMIALAMSLIAGFAGAETLTLTVEDAVDMALRENLELQQSAIGVQTKERARDSAWNVFLPSMAASTEISTSHYGVFDHDNTPSSGFGDAGNLGLNAGLNFSLPINVGLSAGIQNLRTDYQAGLLSYEDAAKNLERDVRKQFYSLLANKESIRIQEANLELAQKRLDQARNNFANGLAPELEVLSAEVTVANMQPVVDSVAAAYESMLLFFQFTLGLPLDVELELDGDLDVELYEDMDAQELISKYMAGRLDIRSLDEQIRALEFAKKGLGMNMNTPTLNLGYTWGIAGSNADSLSAGGMSIPIDPWTDFADFGTLSLGLQWKFDGLIPGSSTSVQLKEMQDGIEAMKLGREMALEAAGMEIINAVNSLATARKTIEANTSSVELARRNYELTEEAYNVGTRELLDVETRQQAYLEATQQLLVKKYEYIAALLDLEYSLNAPKEAFVK